MWFMSDDLFHQGEDRARYIGKVVLFWDVDPIKNEDAVPRVVTLKRFITVRGWEPKRNVLLPIAQELAEEVLAPEASPGNTRTPTAAGLVGMPRVFASGATRDDNANKLAYNKGLSLQVLNRYLGYLGEHRRMKDGSLRDWDNWKRGIPEATYEESLFRHTIDALRAAKRLPVPENATLQDLLCAVVFNSMGWLFELLVKESDNRELGE